MVQSRRTTAATAHGFSKNILKLFSLPVPDSCVGNMPYMLVGVDAHAQPSYRPLALETFQISSGFIANVMYGIWYDLVLFLFFWWPHHTASPIARRMNAQAPVHSFVLNVQRFGF